MYLRVLVFFRFSVCCLPLPLLLLGPVWAAFWCHWAAAAAMCINRFYIENVVRLYRCETRPLVSLSLSLFGASCVCRVSKLLQNVINQNLVQAARLKLKTCPPAWLPLPSPSPPVTVLSPTHKLRFGDAPRQPHSLADLAELLVWLVASKSVRVLC